MFADICRSTYLFSQLGDEQAAALIGKTLNHAGSLVQACQGSVLRSMGDDIMCIFDDPHDALRAALDIPLDRRMGRARIGALALVGLDTEISPRP